MLVPLFPLLLLKFAFEVSFQVGRFGVELILQALLLPPESVLVRGDAQHLGLLLLPEPSQFQLHPVLLLLLPIPPLLLEAPLDLLLLLLQLQLEVLLVLPDLLLHRLPDPLDLGLLLLSQLLLELSQLAVRLLLRLHPHPLLLLLLPLLPPLLLPLDLLLVLLH